MDLRAEAGRTGEAMAGEVGRMKERAGTWLRRAAAVAGATALVGASVGLAGEGQPSDRQLGMQLPVTEIAEQINSLHDMINVIIIAITLFVLALLVIVIVKFNERANPQPSRTTHHTMLEVAWTVLPILILIVIAIPSFRLLFAQYSFPPPDLTIKATGNQWNWDHSYPDQGGFTFKSTMLNDAERGEREKRGIPSPRLLAVDNEVVVPVNKVVHVLVTANDVIHNWTIPSFGSKVDAVPGRTTATWFKVKKEGVFYGQCSELCGKDHAFMPIAVRVVNDQVFNDWSAAMKARDRRKAREIIEKVAIQQAGGKIAATEEPARTAETTAASSTQTR
jgi:cytochrome c oxidase subunit II